MVNWPRAGAMGGAGFQAAFRYRYELRSRLQQADEDLGDDAPADRPQLAALADDLGLLQDVEPQRGLAVPPRIGEDLLEALVLHVELAQDLHHVAVGPVAAMGILTSMRWPATAGRW